MKAIDIPARIPLPFANSGTKATIPVASQIGIHDGWASLTDGFPPLTFTELAAGGIPPRGADFNGIFYEITSDTRWRNAGGSYPYDSAFSTAVGGYPKGAVVINSSADGFWMSAVDDNTTDPDSGSSANWKAFGKNTVPTFAALATTPSFPGQIVRTAGHTNAGIGGQIFQDFAGTITNDTGSQINNTATTGRYWKAIDPQRTPYEFGYIDGGVDASAAINACTLAWGECWLDKSKTYDIQYTVLARSLQCRGGVFTLNCTSPTANTRFGSIGAAVMASPNAYGVTTNTGVLKGINLQGFIVECNKLIGATGSTGLKGVYQYRCENFYNRNIIVRNCASYAFWDQDDATTGTLYCSGTRDDCWAFDSAVSFEQVNVRGVVLNNCHAYISGATLPYTPENMYHAYGGSDMSVTYNNCVGIADGPCPTIFAVLMECKNIAVNDCKFINRYNNGANIQAAVFLETTGGNYDRINFKNCILTSLYSTAVTLTVGASGSPTASFAFTDCTISGKSIGVALFGTGGFYSFTNCITRGDSIGSGQAYGYIRDGASTATVQVTGGSATGAGGTLPQSSNLPASSFNRTILTPAGTALPVIRQQTYGSAVLQVNTGYSQVVVGFPNATLSAAKCVVIGMIDALSATGATAAGLAVPLSVTDLGGNQNYRFFAAQSAAGSTIRYTMTEYE